MHIKALDITEWWAIPGNPHLQTDLARDLARESCLHNKRLDLMRFFMFVCLQKDTNRYCDVTISIVLIVLAIDDNLTMSTINICNSTLFDVFLETTSKSHET